MKIMNDLFFYVAFPIVHDMPFDPLGIKVLEEKVWREGRKGKNVSSSSCAMNFMNSCVLL
jgi:hypothetical protein